MFLELLKAAFFGIVQGITEWLPISSTGHMILFEQFIHMNVSKDFWDMFLVVIQFGSILAVVLLYFQKIAGAETGYLVPLGQSTGRGHSGCCYRTFI